MAGLTSCAHRKSRISLSTGGSSLAEDETVDEAAEALVVVRLRDERDRPAAREREQERPERHIEEGVLDREEVRVEPVHGGRRAEARREPPEPGGGRAALPEDPEEE